MKNGLLKLITAVLIVLFSSRCGDVNIELIDKDSREFTSSIIDPLLASFRNELSADVRKGRVSSNINDRINWSKSYKTFNHRTNRTSYTIPLLVKEQGVYENLIINVDNGKEEKYILRYMPDSEWLKQKSRRGGFSSYTGTIDIQEVDGSIRATSTFQNGEATPIRSIENGRSNACFAAFEMTWTEVSVGGNTYITEIVVHEYIYCDTPGSGGGGGIGGEPIGGGGPSGPGAGIFDPVDVSYFLTPVFAGDDLANPYDGMKATDNNGVVYTWDDDLKAWLMPDLVKLSDSGFQFRFGQNILLTGFDGRILSTMITIALGEPTIIGEVIVGGVILFIIIYEASQINTSLYDFRNYCIERYVDCTDYTWWNDCDFCMEYCIAQQGIWPNACS